MRKDIHAYYQALGLSEGVGPAEIRRAYRQLIQTWHPDLFKAGSLMQTTAEDITKEINEAYEQLYRKKLYKKFPPKAEAPQSTAPAAETEGGDNPRTHGAAATGKPADPHGRGAAATGLGAFRRAATRVRLWEAGAFRGLRRVPWALVGIVACAAAIAVPLGRLLRESMRGSRLAAQATAAETPETVSAARSPSAAESRAGAGGASRAAKAEAMPASGERGAAREGAPVPRIRRLTPADSIQEAALTATAVGVQASAALFREVETLLDVFDVGDSKAKVIAVQGLPDDAGTTVFRYGSSLVYFEDGRVTGWSNRIPWLHVRSWSAFSLASLDSFSIGSSRADVIRAQGEPSEFTPSGYYYGSSFVYFRNDVVAGWVSGDSSLRSADIPVLPFVDLDDLRFSLIGPLTAN